MIWEMLAIIFYRLVSNVVILRDTGIFLIAALQVVRERLDDPVAWVASRVVSNVCDGVVVKAGSCRDDRWLPIL